MLRVLCLSVCFSVSLPSLVSAYVSFDIPRLFFPTETAQGADAARGLATPSTPVLPKK